jgi:hypothetical protein
VQLKGLGADNFLYGNDARWSPVAYNINGIYNQDFICQSRNYMTALLDELDAGRKVAEALKLLVEDVQGYSAWERPCYALDKAKEALTRWREGR